MTEGDSTGETDTVRLSHQPSVDVTVTVSGQAGTDLTLTGLSGTNTLTFTATNWDTAQTVTVKAGQDADGADDSETLTHTASGGEYDGITQSLPVNVDDDETVSVVLNKTSLTVDEGDAAGSAYTVSLSHQPSVDVTMTVSGQAGTDLTLTGLSGTNTLTFTATNWDTAQTVTVKAGQDSDGADESATLTHTATGGEYAGATASLPVTVGDDETVSVVLNKTSLTVDEGDAAGSAYMVSLSHQPSETVTVTVSGQAGTDLMLGGLDTGGTLTFTAADCNSARTVTVTAAQDADGADDSRTLAHTAAGGEYDGAVTTLPVTVDDDEKALLSSVEVNFTTGIHAIQEGGTGTVSVSFSGALVQAVTIPLTTANQGGASAADYSGVPASLTFDAGDTEESFTFSATVDSEDEEGEGIVLSFGTLPGEVSQGTVSQTSISILDVPSVSFGASDYSATEGGADAIVTVQLSEALSADVIIPLTAEGGGVLRLTTGRACQRRSHSPLARRRRPSPSSLSTTR